MLVSVITLLAIVWAQTPTHLVVDIKGQANLKRNTWQIENPLTFGTEVVLGDLIVLDESARVTVLCADLSLEELSGRTFSSVGCSNQAPALYYKGERLSPLRANPDSNLPQVLSPRATKLLSNRPSFTWKAVPDATYTVRLKALPNELVWELKTEKNTLSYPNKPELRAGIIYGLEVEAQVGNKTYFSTAEGVPNLSFRLLDESQAQRVRSDEEVIRELPLGEEAKALALAHLYASNELYAEAIILVKPLAKTAASVPFLLGTLNEVTALPLQAEAYYYESLLTSQKIDDLEGQALSALALGKLFDSHYNNLSKASDYYLLAYQSYTALGDSAMTEALSNTLTELAKN